MEAIDAGRVIICYLSKILVYVFVDVFLLLMFTVNKAWMIIHKQYKVENATIASLSVVDTGKRREVVKVPSSFYNQIVLFTAYSLAPSRFPSRSLQNSLSCSSLFVR